MPYEIKQGDCLTHLPQIPDQSIDAIITDPPYPEIKRPYGMLSEADWHILMDTVVKEAKRVLKPTGSAVFILQPNRSKVGSMRLWLWEFLLRTAKDWNLIQDVYWWNHTALPYLKSDPNYLRSSVKPCLWFGPPDAYRNGKAVLWSESDGNKAKRLSGRLKNHIEHRPSGGTVRDQRTREAVVKRGGVTAFNLLPISNGGSANSSGAYGHGAGTPYQLCEWWTKYITPPGGTILDPFNGAGTTGIAAVKNGRDYIGIEQHEQYCEVSKQRINEAMKNT